MFGMKDLRAAQRSAPEIVSAKIGFNGAYKLGCWTPLSVELESGPSAWSGELQVTVPDTDGVPTRITKPVELDGESQTTIHLVVRVGQSSSPIEVALVGAEGEGLVKRSFFLGSRRVQGTPGGYPATNRLVLELGAGLGLQEVLQADETSDQQLAVRIAEVEELQDLPSEWYGYESLDTVLLSTSKLELFQASTATENRLAALEQWVRRGGELVLFCGANAEQLLNDGGTLAIFSPGKFEKMERLTQPQPLAIFSGSEQFGEIRRINLPVPSLLEVRGQILSSAGRSNQTVPLVVRTQRGLGEIVFVGLDFDQPPLRDWEGRASFLRRVLQWKSTDTDRQVREQRDATDLTNHLRSSLDKQFVGVQVIPFGLLALLAGVYILLIGPGDFFFVRRVLGRPTLTWLTFPLVVLGVSILAYVIANRMKGDQLRVNQIEIVDVDCLQPDQSQSLAYGTVYTHFFTPEVSSLDLNLEVAFLGQAASETSERLVSWLGLPGASLGAMQASGSQTTVFEDGYAFSEDLNELESLPVEVWSTKTLNARWSAAVDPQVQIELRPDGEELVQGIISNRSEVQLEDCALLYGRWAYRLGKLPAGKSVEVDASLRPRTVKTLLTSATAGDEVAARTSDDGTVPFISAKWDVARLLKVMMFYEAVNGEKYTGMVNRYQSFLDLSSTLQHKDQAILLARCETNGSQWRHTGDQALASDQDRRWTYYRFVVKVGD